jgi:hypothetical protein
MLNKDKSLIMIAFKNYFVELFTFSSFMVMASLWSGITVFIAVPGLLLAWIVSAFFKWVVDCLAIIRPRQMLIEYIRGCVNEAIADIPARVEKATEKVKEKAYEGLWKGFRKYVLIFVSLTIGCYLYFKNNKLVPVRVKEGKPEFDEPVILRALRFSTAATALVGSISYGLKISTFWRNTQTVFSILNEMRSTWSSVCDIFTEQKEVEEVLVDEYTLITEERVTLDPKTVVTEEKQKERLSAYEKAEGFTYWKEDWEFHKEGEVIDEDEWLENVAVFEKLVPGVREKKMVRSFKSFFVLKNEFSKFLEGHKIQIAIVASAVFVSCAMWYMYRKYSDVDQTVTESLSEKVEISPEKKKYDGLVLRLESLCNQIESNNKKETGLVSSSDVLPLGAVKEAKGKKHFVEKVGKTIAPDFTPVSGAWADDVTAEMEEFFKQPLVTTSAARPALPNISQKVLGLQGHFGFYFGPAKKNYIDYDPVGKAVVVRDASKLSKNALITKIRTLHKGVYEGKDGKVFKEGIAQVTYQVKAGINYPIRVAFGKDFFNIEADVPKGGEESLMQGKAPINITTTQSHMGIALNKNNNMVCNVTGVGDCIISVHHEVENGRLNQIKFGETITAPKDIKQCEVNSKKLDLVRMSKPSGVKSAPARCCSKDGEDVYIVYYMEGKDNKSNLETFTSYGRMYPDGSHTCSTVPGTCGAIIQSARDNAALGMHYLGHGADNSPNAKHNWCVPFTKDVLTFLGITPKN